MLRNRLNRAAEQVRAAGSCTDLEELERLTMQRVFEQVDGDKEQAQKLLGISRATLYRKIKRYGIQTRRCQKMRTAEVLAGRWSG